MLFSKKQKQIDQIFRKHFMRNYKYFNEKNLIEGEEKPKINMHVPFLNCNLKKTIIKIGRKK